MKPVMVVWVLVLVLALLLSCGNGYSRVTDSVTCSSQWCGTHNISYPFTLTNTPPNCGDPTFNNTLSCDNHNQLFLYFKSRKFYVQSINYNNSTIRLVDSTIINNSSYFLASYNFNSYKSYQHHHKQILYVTCPNAVGSEVDDPPAATCINGSYARGSSSFHVYDGNKTLQELGLQDTCRVEWMYPSSWPGEIDGGNISCVDIRTMLLYGFEIPWGLCFCQHAVFDDQNNNLRCLSQHSPTPLVEVIGEWIYYIILFLVGKFMLGIAFVIFCEWRQKNLGTYYTIEDFLRNNNEILPFRYSYKDIKNITKGFKTKLGNGGYGSVFQGKLPSGRLVAVKVLNNTKTRSNEEEFISEVATIGRIYHVNVVQLIGFCVEGLTRALIYELMENGSLEKYIFSHEKGVFLTCEKLYKISLGVARGIEFMHNGCDMKILHFDIKPQNILLDENFNPKVSDFGLAKLCPTSDSKVSLTAARGTIGYMAPELFYRNIGTISDKADVYSFGMLLMEMASRKKNLNTSAKNCSQIYFPFWVYNQLHDGSEIVIENDTDEEMKLAKKMMIVALWCIQTKPSDRPSMKRVVEMLEQDDEELEISPKPYIYSHDIPAQDVGDFSTSMLFSDVSSVSDSKKIVYSP
ncbi:rust resistance kinase Lr10 [Arachis hypogaea]|uniref:rust resistance kinase Lr10 n=1 Tax=Arachis hypogaea TaxID=3818 RepID=UPI000DEC59EC|nr:rust resistance kinase Lr10 [Arachis hypogaea]